MRKQKATFAAGCFWGVEESFRKVKGVLSTTAGYTGGRIKNPTYQQVCTGITGHAEAVEIVYNPSEVSYDTLLNLFWSIHNPTTLNRQGPDIGTQYRSAIFTHNQAQKRAAFSSRERKQAALKNMIVTEIIPASTFYRAEDYHQHYLEKRHRQTCPSWHRMFKKKLFPFPPPAVVV